LLWTSGRGTWNIGHLILILSAMRSTHPRERNSKRSTYHQRCTSLLGTVVQGSSTKSALVTHFSYDFPRLYLDLPLDIIRSVARFRLCAHTPRVEAMPWTHHTFPTCDLCNANDVQDEQCALFYCTHPHVISHCRTHASLSPQAERLSKVSTTRTCLLF